jgi:HSP20 family protein
MPPFRRGRTPWNRLGSSDHTRIPRVEIIERDQEIIVRAEVPGVNMGDLEFSIAGNIVTIEGKSQHEKHGNKEYYHYSEISRDSFARAVVLPECVDSLYSKAKLIDGVLELRLLKT